MLVILIDSYDSYVYYRHELGQLLGDATVGCGAVSLKRCLSKVRSEPWSCADSAAMWSWCTDAGLAMDFTYNLSHRELQRRLEMSRINSVPQDTTRSPPDSHGVKPA